MNISPCVDRRFSVVVKEYDKIYHIGRNNASSLSLFDNYFMYWKIIIVVETVYPEKIISC